ncbi:MAG: chemotaxis protein CheA [Phycisphaerales bacterium JB037]
MSIENALENIARSLAAADAEDPRRLAEVHERLAEARACAGPGALEAIERASDLIEQMILHEVEDAFSALEQVRGLFAELESRMLRGDDGVPDGNMVAPADIPAPAADASQPVDLSGADGDENLADFLCEAREHLAASEEALLAVDADPDDLESINTVFRAFHTIKGVAGFMVLTPIVELAHAAETLLDAARSRTLSLDRPRINLTLRSCDLMGQLVGALGGGRVPTIGELSGLVRDLESALDAKAALAPSEPPAGGPADGSPAASPESESDDAPAPSTGEPGRRRLEQTVKVSTARMDRLVDMVGELVIAQQMVVQDPAVASLSDQRVQRNLTHAGKIIRDLQEVAMSLRMVTLRGTFQRMARLVRDLSQKAGKRIDLVIEGEDTELDRNVVDEIADPLVHMIRNACDHGIEPESERVASGKPAAGTLTLRAYHQGGSIFIEVIDDGRGLRRDRILAKAVERGLVTPDRDPSEIPDDEVHNMIFLPGFSTAEKVTDISGRGVGMDVVRRNIESLRGKCEIRSTPGKGSTFVMRLPLTMAIIDGMVVRVGTQRYVIPTLSIEQSFRPERSQLSTVGGGRGELVRIRGSLLPVYRLNRVLNLDEGCQDPTRALLVLVEANETRCCVMVDEILGQQQVVIKSLGARGASIRGVSGGAILGDGRVALILDAVGLVAEATRPEAAPRRERSTGERTHPEPARAA